MNFGTMFLLVAMCVMTSLRDALGDLEVDNVPLKWRKSGNSDNIQECIGGSLAAALSVKLNDQEQDPGFNEDKTGLNGIKLTCVDPESGEVTSHISGNAGGKGQWTTKQSCPEGTFIRGFALKIRSPKPSWEDDTSVNNIKVRCQALGGGGVTDLEGEARSSEGEYGAWSDSCPTGQAVCGIRTWVDNSGSSDSTSLNDATFYCC